MKAIIAYFTGTNNTKLVVDEYKKSLEKHDINCQIFNMDNKIFDFDLDNFDYVFIAYPIHAFNAPKIVLEFARDLRKCSDKKKLIIIKVSGEYSRLNNGSSLKLARILKRKNLILNNEYHYLMPYNIIFRHTSEMAFKMFNTMCEIVPLDVEDIVNNKSVKIKQIFMGRTISFLFRIEHFGARYNGKKFKVSEQCNRCFKCLNNCPRHNIVYENGKFEFKNNCLMCMRCSFNCPKNAIKIGLFNKWKVNGNYSFQMPKQKEIDHHPNYFKKSYNRYFKIHEGRINKSKVKI